MIRPNFIAVTATIVLVFVVGWFLGAAVAKNIVVEKRKTEVLDWLVKQEGLEDLLKSKFGIILTTNTGIPGSFRVLIPAGGHSLSDQEIEAIRVELYQRRCPYGITHIDGHEIDYPKPTEQK